MDEDKPDIKPESDEPKPETSQPKPEEKVNIEPEAQSNIKPEAPEPQIRTDLRSEFEPEKVEVAPAPVEKVKKKKEKAPRIVKNKFNIDKQPVAIKLRFKLLLLIVLLAVAIYFGTAPLLKSSAKFLLGRSFPGSLISITSVSIKPTHQITYFDIKVSKQQLYDLTIKEADLNFSIPGIFKKIFPELSLKEVKFVSNSSKARLSELIGSIKLSKARKTLNKVGARPKTSAKDKAKTQQVKNESTSFISKVNIPELDFEINLKDAKANGIASFALNLQNRQIERLNLSAKRFKLGGLYLEDADLNALQGQRKGILKIRQASIAGLKIKAIKSRTVLEGLILSLDNIWGEVLSKKIAGDMTLNLWPVPECTLNAKFGGISSAILAKELGWENKVQLSGKLYGTAIFRSEGSTLAMLDLNIVTSSSGALLTINDQQLLKKTARQTRQPLEVVTKNFKDFVYNKAQVNANFMEDTLNIDIILNGQQGIRNLKFNLVAPAQTNN